MEDKNKEMLEALREFVIDTAKHGERATSAELEAMTEAAWVVVENS